MLCLVVAGTIFKVVMVVNLVFLGGGYRDALLNHANVCSSRTSYLDKLIESRNWVEFGVKG